MFLRKILTSACQFFCFLLLFASIARADVCNCPPMDETEDAYKSSDLVIVGTVSDLKSSNFKPGYMEMIFDIRKLIKANSVIPTHTVVVYVPNDQCKYDFQFGNDYIVYAKGDLFFYRTDVCARNMLFDTSFDELEKLSKLEAGENIQTETENQTSSSSPATAAEL